jgi:uncharacterized protein (DUF2267 family)
MHVTLASEESAFVQQLKKELSFKSTDEVIPRITSVLHAYRQTLTNEQASLIINELPDYFKIAFVTNWQYTEHPVKIDHLDQFIDLLLTRDHDKSLFRSEVEALSVSILVFKKIIELCREKGVLVFSPAIRQQINAVPSEAVAA